MTAFLFTLTLFAYWGVIGLAVTTLFPPRLRVIQGILICPSVGVATLLLPVFFINRLGYPIKDFAPALAIALFAVSALILICKRRLIPVRKLRPYAAILVIALLLSAWPMLLYGFNWVSYANDDMANYCLGAQRFLNYGFLDKPDINDFLAGKNYSLPYWFMHVVANQRAGSELMLATVWGATGLNGHQIFMPVIMALNLALLASATALAAGRGVNKKTPLIAMGLLAISPLNTLGALYQLIGQVGGIGILCAAATLTYRPQNVKSFAQMIRRNVPAMITLMALIVWYPEVLPFFGTGWLVYVAMLARRDREQAFKVILPALLVGTGVLLVLNRYVIAELTFMLLQTGGGFKFGGGQIDLTTLLFPYFLMPSGIAALWGLMSIVQKMPDLLLSSLIAAGIFLSLWLLTRILPRELKRISPPAIMTLIMLLVGLTFFYRNMDFLLFKLVMYSQPFFCGLIAVGVNRILYKKVTLSKRIVVIAVILGLIVQGDYVRRSTGEVSGGLTELPHASGKKVNQQFDTLIHTLHPTADTLLLSTTTNVVLAKYQGLYSEGDALLFPSTDYMISIVSINMHSGKQVDPKVVGAWHDSNMYQVQDLNGNRFFALFPNLVAGKKVIFISAEGTDIFNAYHKSEETLILRAQPEKDITNHLQFVHSLLGPHYYSYGDKKKIAFFQLEGDPMFPGKSFSALGRRLLFRVYNPTPHPRIMMELTDTVVKQFQSQLPTPTVQNATLDFIGRGRGRIFSKPLDLTNVDGLPYVSVDMGRDGLMFADHKEWLMRLYGLDIPLDRRRITAFGHDISLVSEEEYQALSPPANLQHFPADLADKNLEYSGIYEDGWISERSFFMLKPDANAKFFVVKGMVPHVNPGDFHSSLQISIDGKVVATQALTVGEFEIKLPVSVTLGKHRIDLSFDHYQVLRDPDLRPTGGKMSFIGYTDG